MNILITGANGLIGSHLVQKLSAESGIDIKLFDKETESLLNKNDLARLVQGRDVVFHLAAKTNPNDPEIFQINVLAVDNLLAAIRENAPECKIIFPSSFGVYRTPLKGEVIDEHFDIEPRNRYGLTKLLAEEIVTYYSLQYGIKSVILRLSNVYGKAAKPAGSIIATFIEQIKTGQKLTLTGDGNQTRDFVNVDDVVNALLLSTQVQTKDNLILNVCSGEEISIKDLACLLEKLMNKRIEIEYIGENYSGAGYWKGNRDLIKELINWEPKVNLEKGLELLVSR